VRRLVMCFLAGAAFLPATPAHAADALKFGPPPAWVHPQTIPAAKATDAPVSVLLNDEQIAFEHGKVTTYSDAAIKIQTAQGLSAAGNLAVVWQPSTDNVTVNKLLIHRGEKVIDVLASGQSFTTLRRETNLDAATLDGTLTATIQPEGLQQGDILELATTLERSDPVLKGHAEAMFGAWDGLPIQLAHARLSWPSDLRVSVRETPNLPAARRSSAGGMNIFELSAQNVDPLVPPKGAPERFRIGRLAEASDYASWSDLADLMMPLFRDASVIPSSGLLHDDVEKIRISTPDPKARATQALALVQDRIRYVALLMGQGGYVPASADQTWSRRFGDCKGKTALLLGILHSLGIQAEPVLAQAQLGDMVADRLPMIALFNHVLVRAHISGKDYWLDGTRTGDTDLDSIEIPDFGWGLPLVAHAQLVHMVPAPLNQPNLEHRVNIDASAGIYAETPIVIDEIYRGDTAVALNMVYSATTAPQLDEGLRRKAVSYFDDFKVSSSSVQFDVAKREFEIKIKGAAKLSWKDGWFYVPTSSIAFDPDFHRPDGPFHDAPLAVNYPRYTKDEVTIGLPAGVAAQQKLSAAVNETLAGVEYVRSERIDSNILTIASSERSVAPEVPYKDALAAESRLRALDNDDVYLSSAVAYRATDKDMAALSGITPASADEYAERGDLYLNRDNYDDAIVAYTAALKLDPKHQWALGARGLSYVWKREFELAEKDLSAATAENASASNGIVFRARGLMAEFNGDCAKAIDFYTKSLTAEPTNGFSLFQRAQCEANLSKNDEALADSAQALKRNPASVDIRLFRANILALQGKRDLVAAEAEAMTHDNPNLDYAWVAAGNIYNVLGRRDRALEALGRALAIKPSAYAYVSRADVRRFSDSKSSMADFDAALKLEPDNEDALSGKAQMLSDAQDYTAALALLEQAKPEPKKVHLREQRAILLYKMGRKADATKLFNSIRSALKTATELNVLCWSKATAGVLLDSALQDCRDALELKPGMGAYLDSLGMVLLKLGKLDEALDAYNQAIAKDTGADSLMGRAFVYLRKGDTARASADAAAARKIAAKIDDIFAEYGLKFDHPLTATATTH